MINSVVMGTRHSENRSAVVRNAGFELEEKLKIIRLRMERGEWEPVCQVETIYFEYNGRDPNELCDNLHWPQSGPIIARSKPEGFFLFTAPLKLPLPDVLDPKDTRQRNPYKVNRRGESKWKEGDPLDRQRFVKQRLENVASGTLGDDYLVFQPVSQIIGIPFGGKGAWLTVGTRRVPITSLTGTDQSKMALLINPFNGEAFFVGGRYWIDFAGGSPRAFTPQHGAEFTAALRKK
jgi:hypothetical protein